MFSYVLQDSIMLFNLSNHLEDDIISSKNAVSTSKTEHSSSVASRHGQLMNILMNKLMGRDIQGMHILYGKYNLMDKLLII